MVLEKDVVDIPDIVMEIDVIIKIENVKLENYIHIQHIKNVFLKK